MAVRCSSAAFRFADVPQRVQCLRCGSDVRRACVVAAVDLKPRFIVLMLAALNMRMTRCSRSTTTC